jgi:DNA-binding CsgD family transcriptional regulator
MQFSRAEEETIPAEDVLSVREKEIIAWVAEGRTNIQIAGILSISPFTVKNHVQRIIRKLGASNRTEAAVRYRQAAWQQARKKSGRRDGTLLSEQADA